MFYLSGLLGYYPSGVSSRTGCVRADRGIISYQGVCAFILFLFLPLLRAQASVIDSLMTHPRDSIGLTSDSLVLHFLEESGIPISDNNKVKLLIFLGD